MATIDDDLIVEIPTEVIPLAKGALGGEDTSKAADPVAKSAPSADDDRKSDVDVAALKAEREDALRALEAERERATKAEAFAREALAGRSKAEETASVRTDQAMRAHWGKVQSDLSQITGAITATQTEAAAAEREFVSASEVGDHAKAAQAQRIMARAEAALIQLENGKAVAEQEIETARRVFKQHSEEAASRPEPVKQVETPKTLTPDEWIDSTKAAIGDDGAAWLKTHREFVTDAKLNKKLLRFADEYADDHGHHALKSAGFKKALDEKFGFAKGNDDVELSEDRSAPKQTSEAARPRTTSAAPVSRSGNLFSSRNLDASQVKLPPRLAKFVRDSGLNATEYALAAVADIKAGRLPKNYLDPDYDHGI